MLHVAVGLAVAIARAIVALTGAVCLSVETHQQVKIMLQQLTADVKVRCNY
jgi:hypothetical protein